MERTATHAAGLPTLQPMPPDRARGESFPVELRGSRRSGRRNNISGMTSVSKHSPSSFAAPERDLLRRELCRHFGQDPSIADGIFLRTWRTGQRRNQPRIPPAVRSMMERGLIELRTTSRGPRAFFTEAGLAALRQLLLDRRVMDPERFAHLRAELGFPIKNE